MTVQRRPAGTLLDACAVLSLYATGHMAAIVAVTPGPVAVSDVVLQEALYIRRIVNGESEREPIEIAPLVASGLIVVLEARNDAELETFVDLSVDLDDGEAMTAALAIHRAYELVTDDAKAERLLSGRVQLRSTLELVKDWAVAQHVDSPTLRTALVGIYERGYQPPNRHPLKVWWDTSLGGGALDR